MNSISHVSEHTFDREVLRSPIPVLVDFYADWCGPCRTLAPTLEQLATAFAGRVKIVKVNVDNEPRLAEQFQVHSIPTLALVDGGRIVERTTGLVSGASLRNSLNRLAGATPPQNRRAG